MIAPVETLSESTILRLRDLAKCGRAELIDVLLCKRHRPEADTVDIAVRVFGSPKSEPVVCRILWGYGDMMRARAVAA